MFSKRITKSLLALLLVVSMLALCACGGSNTETSSTDPTESIPQTPEEKFEKAGKDITNGIIDPVFSVFEAMENATPDTSALNQTVNINTKIRLGETIQNSLTSMIGLDFDWINDASIDFTTLTKDSYLSTGISLSHDNYALIGASILMDNENQTAYISIPQLFEQNLKLDMSQAAGIDPTASLALIENMPDMAKVKTILVKYIDLVLSSVDKIEESQGVMEIDGVSENCTILTVTLTAQDLTDICKNVLETAAADEDIKTVISEIAVFLSQMTGEEINADEGYAAFQESITDMITEIDLRVAEATEEELAEALILTEYLDADFGLTGMKIEVPSDSESNVVFFIGSAEKDGKTRATIYTGTNNEKDFELNAAIDETDTTFKANFEFLENDISVASSNVDLKKEGETVSGDLEVFVDENPVFAIGIELTESGNTISGHLEFFIDDESMFFLDIENLDTAKLEEGNVTGTFSISPSTGLIKILDNMLYGSGIPSNIFSSFALTFNFTDDTMTVSLMNGEEEYFGLIFTVTMTETADIQIPGNLTTNPTEWSENMDFAGFIENLMNSNLPDDIKMYIYMLSYQM